MDLTPENENLKTKYLKIGGFFSINGNPVTVISGTPGELRWDGNAQGAHTDMTSKGYNIMFDKLLQGLNYVKNIDFDPPAYFLYTKNCADVAIEVGESAGQPTMSTEGFTTPENFYNWLNSN